MLAEEVTERFESEAGCGARRNTPFPPAWGSGDTVRAPWAPPPQGQISGQPGREGRAESRSHSAPAASNPGGRGTRRPLAAEVTPPLRALFAAPHRWQR